MRSRWRYNPETKEMEQIETLAQQRSRLIMFDLPGYVSPASGKWIEGRKARREDLARTGCRPFEGRAAEQQEIRRGEAYREAALDRRIDHNVRSTLAEMPARVRRDLLGRA